MTAPTMTAGDVRDALYRRWPAEEYVHVHEAPDDAARTGRKLDAVVFSTWRSRGFEIDGIEIKVTMADLKREITNAAKADWWWQHVHRFWVAVPAPLAARILAGEGDGKLFGGAHDWPDTWGLLSCTPDAAPTVARKAQRHDPEPLPWSATVGCLRSAVGSSHTLLQTARAAGRDEGRAAARAEFERTTGDATLRRTVEELRTKIADFEKASGIDIAAAWSGSHLGEQVALLNRIAANPDTIASVLDSTAKTVRRQADGMEQLAKFVRTLEPTKAGKVPAA